MAEAALFITVASVLNCFDIGKEVDANGNEVEPNAEFFSGLIQWVYLYFEW